MSLEKCDATYHIIKNAQSAGLGRYSKTKKIYKDEI